ncbi:MAG: ABC transporter permease [Balneola sp.]
MKKPSFIIRFLDSLLPPDLHHLIGDLEEEFSINTQHEGILKARLHFWWQLTRSAPWFFYQSLIWNTEMLLNYLKITWRNFKKYTSFSLINIVGLSASMSVCLLILLFLIDQKSYDHFHEKSDRIVRIMSDFKSASNFTSDLYATTPHVLADFLDDQFPVVEKAVKVRGNFEGEFRNENVTVPLSGFYAENSFFSIFDFELEQGNPSTALENPGSVVLTSEAAIRLFGTKDALDKSFTGLGDREYIVTGIIEEQYRTHFTFEAIASLSTLLADPQIEERLNIWNLSIFDSYTYVLLKKDADLERFQADLQPLIADHFVDTERDYKLDRLIVQPLTSINLGDESSNEIGIVVPRIVAIFLGGLCVIIILISIFNYVSLTIARALNRGKEVGVRKVLGANRSRVIHQFLFESVIIAFVALLNGILLLRWLLPEFNNLFFISFTNNQVEADLLLNPWTVLIFITFTFLVGIIAGLYPSIYLSRFNPALILKGLLKTGNISGQFLKKMITVGQFSFSIIFIITSIILVRQFKFMTTADYGFEQENIIHIEHQDIPYEQVRDILRASPRVAEASVTSTVPALGSIQTANMKSDSTDQVFTTHTYNVDEHFISVMGLNLVAGRNFNPDMSTDSTQSIIISREAVSLLGFKNPGLAIGNEVDINNGDFILTIIGVIDGFISSDPLSNDDPIALFFTPERSNYAIAKVLPGQTFDFISEMEEQWENTGSVFSLKYRVFNEQLEESPALVVFVDFIKIITLIGVFSVIISCLGLLGMAMYSAENRVKEIGIRKVLGASENSIIYLLSKEYFILILISILIGVPLAYIVNNLWLQNVSNKIELDASIFVFGILGTLVLAMITIGSQALKAAKANSIDNLRSE